MKLFRTTMPGVIAVVLLLLSSLAAPLAEVTRADDGEGNIVLNPSSVAPGETVTVTGSGLPADEDGDLLWADEDESIGPVHTDGNGNFVATFAAPAWESGDYDVAVEIESADAKATLSIIAPENATEVPSDTPYPTEVPTDEPTEPANPTPTTKTNNTPENLTETPSGTKAPEVTSTPTKSEVESVSAASAENAIWVATNGSDSNAGTQANPFRTLQKALSVVTAGQTINLKAGAHVLGDTAMSSRNGTSSRPITIQSAPGEKAIISGPSSEHGLQINNSWYVIRNLEFTSADILLWLDGATNVVITGNYFHDSGGECVRIKNQSKNNTFSGNTVKNCGREGFDLAAGHKNGEGVYVGTAPEQRSKIGGVPDSSTGNVIENNTFQTNGSEAVDLKEDAEYNIVRNNTASGNRDPEGANFGSRGDNNSFTGNISYNSAGAGFRAGGDTVDGREYGKNNVYRNNDSHDNAMHGYKFMVGPQDADCSNTSENNGGEDYYFGGDEFSIPCTGSSNPTKTPTPKPTKTATPQPTRTPAPTTIKLVATADTQVAAHNPTTNYGNSRSFRVDASPQTVTYLKFTVSGVRGRVINKVLIRIYVLDAGGESLSICAVGSASWAETSLTWQNRPGLKPSYSSASGRNAVGHWLTFDVTGLVKHDGTYAFALTTNSADGYSFVSSEATSNRPNMVVTVK